MGQEWYGMNVIIRCIVLLTEQEDEIIEWFWKYKDKIIDCLSQSDANWVYDSDDARDEIRRIINED